MCFDHNPAKLCFSCSGFPSPEEGSSDRSISFNNLQSALCSFLSFSRKASYELQVSPSNTSDLIQLIFRRLVSSIQRMGANRFGYLPHQVGILQYIQVFLLSFPIIGTNYYKILSSSASDFERLMAYNYLFYKSFQVVPEFIHTNDIHIYHQLYGLSVHNSVKALTRLANRTSASCIGFYKKTAKTNPAHDNRCWRRYSVRYEV
jgi:hypothetical protein